MGRTNLAIKCNYCNGGSDSNKLYYGYDGVCTQGVMEYNITQAKYDWCKNPRSSCNRFFKRKITYDQLLQEYADNGSVCYESAMLDRWEALAGWDHNGVRGDRPRRILGAETGSLAVLTLLTPNSFEYERRIFALFIIDEYFVGNDETEGYITSKSKYKLHFTRKETNDMRFWQFYENENTSEKKWGSGLFRYLSDGQSAQILKQAAKLKIGTSDELLANELYDTYCRRKAVEGV